MDELDPKLMGEVDKIERQIRDITDQVPMNMALCALGLVLTTYIANVAKEAGENGGEMISKYFSSLSGAATSAWKRWTFGEERRTH